MLQRRNRPKICSPAPATKDNKDGSSGGSSVDGTSGQDGANSQNQTDKASGSDKAGNKTNENQWITTINFLAAKNARNDRIRRRL